MKAARRIRAYLHSVQSGKETDSLYYLEPHAAMGTDLEEVLLSRARYRRRARAEHRAAQALLAELEQAQMERDALSEELRTMRESYAATARQLQSEREQNRGFVKSLDDTFGVIRSLYAELGGNPGVLPVNDGPRMLSWLSVRIHDRAREQGTEPQYQALRQALREVCAEVLPAYKDKDAGQQLSALESAVRIPASQGAVNISENAAPDVIDVLQNALNRSSSRDEPIVMSRGQAWQLLRRAKADTAVPESKGVQAISEARAYQMRVHSAQENKRRELLAAAIALVSGVSALYPFGEDSWEGIRRRNGRKAQLAHAGACIAALIDLLPSGNVPLQEAARQARRIVRDRAAYPGEEGDLW